MTKLNLNVSIGENLNQIKTTNFIYIFLKYYNNKKGFKMNKADEELALIQRKLELNNASFEVRFRAVEKYDLTDEERETALTDERAGLRYITVRKGNLNPVQQTRAIKDPDHAIRQEAVMFGNFTDEDLELIRNDPVHHVRRRALETLKREKK